MATPQPSSSKQPPLSAALLQQQAEAPLICPHKDGRRKQLAQQAAARDAASSSAEPADRPDRTVKWLSASTPPGAEAAANAQQTSSSSSSSSSSSASSVPAMAPDLAQQASSDQCTVARVDSQAQALTTPFLDRVPLNSVPAAGRGNSDDGREWLNPSANQIYRACKRKGKDVEVVDAARMAYIHEHITSESWDAVMEYEQLHLDSCPNPSLANFQGMDGHYSAKAKLMNRIFGVPLPYDRHDWTVDRCGKDVKYIVDYYAYDDEAARSATSGDQPHVIEGVATASDGDDDGTGLGDSETFYIDARPAPSGGVGALSDRLRVAFGRWRQGMSIW